MTMMNNNEDQSPQNQRMDTIIFTEVHLLADKLVLVVAVHSLRGSRTNWHHTPNPQPGATQPTQDKDPQATLNPLELPLVLRRGRHKNPSQSQRSELKTISFLHSTIYQSPEHLGVGKHQE